MKANLCFTAFCVVFTVLSCFSFSTVNSDSNNLTNSIKKFQPNLNSSFRENDDFCLGQFDIRDFQITPFEAIYVDNKFNPHIKLKDDLPEDLAMLNNFILNEVEPWYLGLQITSLGSKARSNYQYHSYRRAKHSIVVGNLVTPTTDPGDYIVEANGKLTLKAGDEIVLKNGVHFKAGSTVHIKPEYEACHDFKSDGSAGLNGVSNAENEHYESAKYFTSNQATIPSLAIYPNPSSGKFTIEAQQKSNIVSIEVYAMNGTLQFSEQNIHKQSITLETTLEKGAYLVVTKLEDETMRNKIIVFGFGKFFMALLVLSLLTTCGKVNRVTLKGRVLNPVTGEGIEGIKVVLKKSTSGFPAGEKTVSSTYSASDGSFELTANKLKTTIADCIFDEDKYYWLGWKKDNTYQTYITLPKGKTTQLDYHAVPYGGAILDIENINCLGSNDTMQFRRKYQFDSAFPENWSTNRIGCYSYISPEPFNLPMGYHYYESKVTRNGITSFFYDTVYVNNIGVSTVEIRY